MQRDNLIIRKGKPADVGSIAEIETLCFAHPWSEEDLLGGFQNFTHYFVAEAEGELLGYCGMQVIAGEGYITNVAVRPEYRRQGIAGELLRVFRRFAEGNHMAFLTLEVRDSNASARALYTKHGFKEVGVRKNYYDHPKEDAIIMTLEFPQ